MKSKKDKTKKITHHRRTIDPRQTTKKIDLSITVVSLNTKELTRQTIESALLAAKDIKVEIIVVDNLSTDGSIEMLKKLGSKIKLIENARNLGFGAANDHGAHYAHGRYLLFLNSDTIVPKDSLKQIVALMDKNSEIAIAGPKLVNDKNQHLPQKGSFGRFFTPWRILLRLSAKTPELQKNQELTLVDWITGAALVIRREVYNLLGGFDENIFLYYEDQDLCLRAKKLDLEVAVFNNIEIIHLGGRSTTKKQRTKFYDQAQNYFINKHYGLIWSSLINLFRLPYRLLK